ncbi:MAG: EAL domain-containing protein [Acidobacteria bacterium]|nr:EAL domain-containing protein [Acidobacteriota bacterium]
MRIYPDSIGANREGMQGGETIVGGRESEGNRIRVLLIEDDESSRLKLRAALDAGFAQVEVEEIVDHVGFFRAVKDADFDLVITAQDLHWSSGAEILNAVKSLRPAIPVIMAAKNEDEGVAAAALEAGLDAYVVEAAERPTRLASAVRSALQVIDYEDRVESLEERLQVLLDRLNVGVFRCTPEGELLEANPAFLRLIGTETLEKAQQLGFDAFCTDRQELIERLLESGHQRDAKVQIRRPDGGTTWVALTQTLDTTEDGERFVDGLAEDVTLAQQGEELLRQANEHYRTIFEVTSAATAIIDPDATVSLVNSAFERLSGYSRDEIEDRMVWTEFIARDDAARIREQHRRRLREEDPSPQTSSFDFIDREGKILHLTATEAILPGSQRTVVSLLNLTDRRRAEQELLHRAFHDPRTGLPNRDALLERLEGVMESGDAGYAILVLDLDSFGVVSGGLGYRVAELFLKEVADRLEQNVGGSSFLASIGGGSFAVLLHPVYAPDQAEVVAGGLVEALGSPLRVEKHRLYTSASIGIYVGEDVADPEGVLRDAETAAHRSKQLGGGRSTLFEPLFREEAARVQEVEGDLRRALREGDFRVHYQPIASLTEGTIVGFEALLRWHPPGGELLEPAHFLDVAEASGLIVPIGTWVLEAACRQLREWDRGAAAPQELFVSVNLSRLQLIQPDLVETVARVLRKTEVEPQRLMLEMRVVDLGQEGVLDTVERLSELGVQIGAEEFGGSMVLLDEVSARGVSTLKIDHLMLVGVGEDSDRWRNVELINRIAKDLDLRVIAEGIEDSEQLERLLELSCDCGQGNLFSMPVDAAAATDLLQVDLMW